MTARSLSELVEGSEVIVIGTVADGAPETRHIPGQLRSDPTKPDPDYTGIAQVYTVDVERYLKGIGQPDLPVVQFVGSIYNNGVQVREVRYDNAGLPLASMERYLLFLRP